MLPGLVIMLFILKRIILNGIFISKNKINFI